jgi:hypothetical protein
MLVVLRVKKIILHIYGGLFFTGICTIISIVVSLTCTAVILFSAVVDVFTNG